ncbi:MAG: cytochrome C [Gammaproteobacteria bacterium SG8_11]|nr:MAG: cytochrome C [Gammaproteobacteria bacterium SG8_11]
MYNRVVFACALLLVSDGVLKADNLEPKQQLGSALFFDRSLSLNDNQACGDCHSPAAGWTGDLSEINAHGAAYQGSITTRFGNRKPPSAAYATNSPIFHFDKQEELFIGGNFWNGRATGEKLGNPAADQAQGPFLNPMEHALPDSACVVYKVCGANYPVKLDSVWPGACDIRWPSDIKAACKTDGATVELAKADRAKVDKAYDNIALAIAAFEASPTVNAFTSKYDYYLAGLVKLSQQELRGMELFKDKGKCAACHPMEAGENGEPPLFTDFTFDNLGTPRNPENPWYRMPKQFNPDGAEWVDAGLGAFLAERSEYKQYAQENYGKQKVPTVRNVDKRPSSNFVKAYMHNGYFKTLKGLVNFYNTRDVKPVCKNPLTTEAEALKQGCWPAAEISDNVNKEELGDLGLTEAEEDAIVAFMKALSDGYAPPEGVTVLTPGQR